MAFVTPLFLLGLLGVGIPLLVHLIRRQKPPRLPFGSIRFLQQTPKKIMLFQRWQQIALMVLRAAVVALLVLAFARPVITPSAARVVEAAPRSVVVLLDGSLSMRHGEAFARAREEARGVLARLDASDEAALIRFADSAQLLRKLDGDIPELLALVGTMEEAGFGATRYYPALRLADQLLSDSTYAERAVYLISDFRQWDPGSGDEGWKLAPGVALHTIDVGLPGAGNLVLTQVRYPGQLFGGGPPQQILARLQSTGSRSFDEAEVALGINGQWLEQRRVELGDATEQVLDFDSDFGQAGTYLGELRVTGDGFVDDNAYFFAVEVLPKIRVLVVNGEASESWFDDEAHWFAVAAGGPETSPFQLQSLTPEALSASSLDQNDVLVLLNVGELGEGQAQAVADFVAAGGGLLLAPGDQVDGQRFNRQFADLTPARLQQRVQTGREDYLVIADRVQHHPVMLPLQGDWVARFSGYWSLLPAADGQVLMRFDNAEPALVEKQAGAGRVMLFASSLDLEWNNLALQGRFLPFVHEILRHLRRSEPLPRSYLVGDVVDLPGADRADRISVVDSRGQRLAVDDDPVLRATRPGLYQASVDDLVVPYVVNVVPQEGDFTPMAADAVHDAVINPDTSPFPSRAQRTASMTAELERSQRLWWYLLVLVMLLLLAEAGLANRTCR